MRLSLVSTWPCYTRMFLSVKLSMFGPVVLGYQLPPVDKATFKTLLEITARDVLMLTHDGYHQQRDGSAMVSPPAPPLANGWMDLHDHKIRDDIKLYLRYIDDIIRSISKNNVESDLLQIKNLHPSLSFTSETEKEG